MNTTGSTVQCHWCGISLGNATNITLLNGNLPVCDLCLIKARENSTWNTGKNASIKARWYWDGSIDSV